MKLSSFLEILPAGLLVLLLLGAGYGHCAEEESTGIPVRIGWQMSAGTQGQIVQVLKRTDVLEKHGLQPVFVPFSYGGPQVDAALAGQLDVLFSGDQPAINLIAQGGKWKIVARLFYDRPAILVPLNSPLKEPKDLKGKTVASPFKSIAHREAILKEQAAGLDADQDVKNVDMDILDIRNRVLSGGGETWGEIDAVTTWEPSTSQFELGGLARSLSTTRTLGVVAVSDEFLTRHPKAATQFLVAVMRAWGFFSHHPDRVRQWYLDDSLLGFTLESLQASVKMDPNFGATSLSEIDLRLTEEHIAALEQGAAWALERRYSKALAQVRKAVNQDVLAGAIKEIAQAQFDDLQVILPSAREAETDGGATGRVFDALPLWAVFLIVVVLTMLSIETGQRMGARHRRMAEHEQESAVSTVVAAVLGLLAFVIGLTFSAAGSRLDANKEALLEDVTSIRTAYLRAGLVPEPHKTATRALLRDYVELRIGMFDLMGSPAQLRELRLRAMALQGLLWSHAEELCAQDRNDIYAQFSESLTDVFRAQTRRIAFGAHFRIPVFVWCVVILSSCIAMFVVGFQFGLSGRRSFPAQVALALTFALLMQLIYDMDRPGRGFIDTSQQPMIDLYTNLGK